MHSAPLRAAAVSPETAVIVQDYPYGFRLRCTLRAWVEYRKGKGFRYVTQTQDPKSGRWNKPKPGTYHRVSMAIGVDALGHLYPAALSEYSSLEEYAQFRAAHAAALSVDAYGSLNYYESVKSAYEAKRAELGIDNIYNATPEQQRACKLAYGAVLAAHIKAGTDY